MTSPQPDAFRDYNTRVYYACQAVLVNRKSDSAGNTFGRNTQDEDLAYVPTNGFFLRGVQSVGVSQSIPSDSLTDVGRFQQKFHYFQKPQFEITIERNNTI
jgi:C-terminal processing protease CtpA/Prc